MLKCCLLDSVLSTLLASRVLCYCVCLCSFSLFEVIFGPAVQCPHLVSPWWRDGCSTKVKQSHRRSSLHLALMSSLLNLQIFFIFKRKKKTQQQQYFASYFSFFFFFFNWQTQETAQGRGGWSLQQLTGEGQKVRVRERQRRRAVTSYSH